MTEKKIKKCKYWDKCRHYHPDDITCNEEEGLYDVDGEYKDCEYVGCYNPFCN